MFRYAQFHLRGVVFLIQPRTVHGEQTLQSSMAIPKKRKETKMLQTCMTSISRSLVGESNPSHGDLNSGLFKSPDSATVWGLPGCHSPRHAPGKGQGVVWDQSWCWWGRTVIYFMTWQQVLPIFFGSMQEVSLQVPGLFSIATPERSGGNSTVLCPFRSLTQHQLC